MSGTVSFTPVPIPGLAQASLPINPTDAMIVSQNGIARQVQVQNIASGILVLSGITLEGTITNAGTVVGGTYSGNIALYGTLTNHGTISGGIISGSTLNTVDLVNATLSGTTTNAGTIAGGAWSGTITNTGIVQGGTFENLTLAGAITNSGTISGGALAGVIANNGTISGGTVSSAVSASTVIASGASASRSLAARASDFANVLDYGADPTFTNSCDSAFAAAIASGKTLVGPPGKYKITTAIVSGGAQNIIFFGAGRGQCQIVQVTAGADGWQHGLVTPATGCFRMYGVDLLCVGTGGSALNMQWGSTTDINLFVLEDVEFSGVALNSDAWGTPFQTINYPYASSWQRVQAFGANSGATPQATNAFTFNANQGAFQFTFIDCMVSGYTWAWDFVFTGSGHRHEGVYMLRCGSYNGMGLLQALNGLSTYFSPNWVLDACGYQGAGAAVAVSQLTQINIHDGIFYTNPDLGASPRILFSFLNCQNSKIADNFVGIPPSSGGSSTDVMFYVSGASTYGVIFDSNQIYNTDTFGSIFKFESGMNVNSVQERSTIVEEIGTWSVGQVNDVGGNQVSSLALSITSLNGTGGVVGDIPYGIMLLRGLYIGNTDAHGQLAVLYPVRPVTGLPFFQSMDPITVFSNVNYTPTFYDVEPAPRINAQSNTGFQVIFPGAGAGVQVSISWMSFGA